MKGRNDEGGAENEKKFGRKRRKRWERKGEDKKRGRERRKRERGQIERGLEIRAVHSETCLTLLCPGKTTFNDVENSFRGEVMFRVYYKQSRQGA
jgi:hypothetical protein